MKTKKTAAKAQRCKVALCVWGLRAHQVWPQDKQGWDSDKLSEVPRYKNLRRHSPTFLS